MNILDQLPAKDVGERLRLARERVGINQTEASESADIARTTLVAIEKGERRVRIGELQALCRKYQTNINALLHQEAVQLDLEPQFRKLSKCKDEAVENAARLLSDMAQAELELERLLGIKRPRNDPPERPILPGDVKIQAEQDAQELRQWLGIGTGPINDMATLLEINLGARIYIRKIDGKISGAFIFDQQTGPCILLNANHPVSRRNQSAAHELGHYISSRSKPEISDESDSVSSKEEKYADAFARAFLMPARLVMQKFREITASSTKLTRRHVIILSHYFSVSREAIVHRFEELRLVKSGTWDWFCNEGGITDIQASQVLGDRIPDKEKDISNARATELRLALLAAEAYRQEIMSEGQLARRLNMSRIELREIIDEAAQEGGESEVGTILPV